MAKTALLFPALCIGALLLSGCMASSPSPGGTTSTTLPTPAVTITPADNQTCNVYADCVPAPTSPAETSLQLTVTPKKYSPLMSSTVGVGISVNASGFNLADSLVIWNAT
jgi:PBP1b-binding outer membrane lipoprotein LpoB